MLQKTLALTLQRQDPETFGVLWEPTGPLIQGEPGHDGVPVLTT